MRRPLISGNWKMNLNHFEAIQTVQKLHYLIPREAYRNVDVSVHPPFTDIRSVQTVIEADDLDLLLGAQHCHWEAKGAFTGEVSPLFLAKLDVELVVCGHSERRELFGETDEMVGRKVIAIQQHGMVPIMCVGESLAEREAGETETKVLTQVRAGLAGRSSRAGRFVGDRLRADLGDRHRSDGDCRRCPGDVCGHSRLHRRGMGRATRPTPSASSTAVRSRRERPLS